jgi:hypothetical protein
MPACEGAHSHAGEWGVGESQFQQGDIHCGILHILYIQYMYFVLYTFKDRKRIYHCKSNIKNFTFSLKVQCTVYRGRSSFKDEQLQYVLVIFYSLSLLNFDKITVMSSQKRGFETEAVDLEEPHSAKPAQRSSHPARQATDPLPLAYVDWWACTATPLRARLADYKVRLKLPPLVSFNRFDFVYIINDI